MNKMFECFICGEEREEDNYWSCDQCSKQTCLHCFDRITQSPVSRCPYCRFSLDTNPWGFPIVIPFDYPPFVNQEMENYTLNLPVTDILQQAITDISTAIEILDSFLNSTSEPSSD